MTYTYLGELSLGACVPLALTAQALVVPELAAKVAGLLKVQAALTITPPSIAGQLALAAKMVANLEVAPPGASLQLAGIAKLLAEIQASLSAWVAIGVSLGTPGVFAYTYEGPANQLIPGGLPGNPPAVPCNAVIFIATDAGVWSGMQAVFATG
jgi:hypothetical protein